MKQQGKGGITKEGHNRYYHPAAADTRIWLRPDEEETRARTPDVEGEHSNHESETFSWVTQSLEGLVRAKSAASYRRAIN